MVRPMEIKEIWAVKSAILQFKGSVIEQRKYFPSRLAGPKTSMNATKLEQWEQTKIQQPLPIARKWDAHEHEMWFDQMI